MYPGSGSREATALEALIVRVLLGVPRAATPSKCSHRSSPVLTDRPVHVHVVESVALIQIAHEVLIV